MSEVLNIDGWHERNSEQQPLMSALEHYRCGRTCVYNCDAVGAEKSFRKALKVIPEMPEALGGLASVALGHGTFQNALEFSERAIASAPAYSRGWLNRSVARHCLKDKAGALSDAIHATKLTPTHSMAWVVLAGVYSDLDPPQFKDAQTAIEVAEQFVDEDGSTTSAKLELLVAMGDMAKAKALIVETNQFSFVPMIKERLLSLEANIAIGERRFEEARTILLSLTEPPYSSYRFNAAHAWYRLATLEVSRDSPPARLHSALQYVTRATTLCVETSAFLSWETWLRVTLASHTSGHEAARMFRQAIKTADAAIRISPEDTDLRMWRASAARNLAWSLKDGSTTNSVREYEVDETTFMNCDGGVSCDSP